MCDPAILPDFQKEFCRLRHTSLSGVNE